ncbi:unnamed protein product [Porites evermanni]|uniref:Uncharacterized protein n=1 Tax=Porites evermanni TaxID=104178 RepID=A0ABN8SJR5_9CNID|nr:unnamed protein product [Porites evermanni]
MKRDMMIICLLLLLTEVDTWRRRRRRRRAAPPPCSAVNCVVSSWTGWSFCSHQCGTSGTQARSRQQTRAASCGGTCPYHLRETRACNRDRCQYGGTPQSYGCSCRAGYGGTCCGQGELYRSANSAATAFFLRPASTERGFIPAFCLSFHKTSRFSLCQHSKTNMKRSFIIICALLLIMEANYFFWRRRRRRRSSPPCSAVNCLVDSWTSWSSCSHQCGTSGTRERTRQQTRVASCGGTCPYELWQTEACNRDSCQNGGTPHSSGCSCRTGYGGGLLRARRRGGGGPPPCGPRNCVVGSWNAWSACSHQCGTSGTQRRTRPQVSPASCGGSCPYTFSDNRACNRDNCQNGGTPHSSGCSCRPGYKGTCCEGE